MRFFFKLKCLKFHSPENISPNNSSPNMSDQAEQSRRQKLLQHHIEFLEVDLTDGQSKLCHLPMALFQTFEILKIAKSELFTIILHQDFDNFGDSKPFMMQKKK
ncbi:hypothetical protein CEXT_239551 [Caerostris extrusa]|uniref:Uncharacterized protein n=1 Tax=Caerostris extrusa TaxID=172846 RepID=A0AAV4UN33_CAEEX|nr:hypothetical protein CEXT_239551 [Caerostris extrusa]